MQNNRIYIYKVKVKHKKWVKWVKILVALANDKGGTLYFGMKSENDVKGIINPDKEIEFITEKITKLIQPQISFTISKKTIYNKIVIQLEVAVSSQLVWFTNKDKLLVSYVYKDSRIVPLTYADLVTSMVNKPNKDENLKYMKEIVAYCQTPKTRQEIQDYIGIASRPYFREAILLPLIETGLILPTNPNPRASNQKYIAKK